jgi:hypothetical protein
LLERAAGGIPDFADKLGHILELRRLAHRDV